jgi:bifunctional DNA-binding transcriptional regulator/antitoxin component of YhaV-PrlF toxin-antitoxin module
MPARSPVTLLNVAQNGQVTIPAAFRKDHALANGGRLMAVRMGDALVMVPHDVKCDMHAIRRGTSGLRHQHQRNQSAGTPGTR